jgi:hypothetical protein
MSVLSIVAALGETEPRMLPPIVLLLLPRYDPSGSMCVSHDASLQRGALPVDTEAR